MRNLLLSVALVAVPTALFAAVYALEAPGPTHTADAGPPLGDMTPFTEIVSDVQSIAAIGDFSAAEERITDLETAWDNAEPTLQPVNPAQWGNVDAAADAALD